MARTKLTPRALFAMGLCGGVSGGTTGALTFYVLHLHDFWLIEISVGVLTPTVMAPLLLLLRRFGILPTWYKLSWRTPQ